MPAKPAAILNFCLIFFVTVLLIGMVSELLPRVYGTAPPLWASYAGTALVAALVAAVSALVIGLNTNRFLKANSDLNELLKFNESILFNSPLPMAVYSKAGQCLEVNDAYAHIFSATRSAMLLYHNFSVFEACGLLQAIQRVLTENTTGRFEVHDTSLFGREVWFDCELLPFNHKNQSHVLIQFYDFTQRKIAEEKLQAMNHDLQLAMKHLVQSEKMAALGNLVAGVAHELNTPIGNALMASSTLNSHVTELNDSMQRGVLKRSVLEQYINEARDESDLIERNIVRAGNLVRSFKQVAVDQSSDCRRQFDLKSVVTHVAVTMRPVLDKSRHRLSVDIDEPIQLDSFPGAIEQVVTSFIDNALIHAFAATDTGSMVLRATIHEGLVALEFSDNGNGMDEHTAKHAFDPFFSTRMGIGGSGLGLYIVNNIVTSVLGGTIELVTSPGNGTRFQLRLPQVAPEPEMEQNRSV